MPRVSCQLHMYALLRSLLLLLLVLLPTRGQDRVWTRMEGSSGNDIGYGVSVDTSTGDVYVTGQAVASLHGQPYVASNDIFLMKYASNGTRVWTRMEGTSGNDFGLGVSVDTSTGDVYVTGQAGASLHGQPYVASLDIFLMKYASNGTRVWTRMAGTSGNDRGNGVSVDTSTGDVYVTGQAVASLHGQPYVASNDIFLMKYARNGTRVWTRMEGTSGNDFGLGVSVDTSTGDVYVTGQAGASLHGQPYVLFDDVILMKYASNGTRVWTRMAGTSGWDIGYGVSVDTSTGDVYVTGQAGASLHSQPYAVSEDIFLMRYTSNGTRVWTRMEGTSGTDRGLGLSVDTSTGDVYVTGQAGASLHGQLYVALADILLIKYARNGTRVWSTMVGTSGDDVCFGVSADTSTGDVFVTGRSSAILHGQPYVAGADVILMKYASNGTRVWTRMEGSSGDDVGRGVSVDTNTGDIYITGFVAASLHGQPYVASNDIFLMKYARNGTRVWTRMAGSSGWDIGWGVSVDTSTGDVYVTGEAGASLHGQPYVASLDIFLIKYTSNGTRVWTRMEGSSGGNDIGFGVSVDTSTGDVYVTGLAGASLHGQPYVALNDIFLMKYASNGTRVWTRMEGTSGNDVGWGVSVHTSTGDVYVTGHAGASLHGQPYVAGADIMLMKYARNGTRVWTRMEGTNGDDLSRGVSVDTNTGDVYVAGRAGASLHGQPYVASLDIFLMKYTSNGTRVWTRMAGTSGNDIGFGVSVDTSTGDVYVTGHASASLHSQPYVALNDIFLMKYASNGTRVWTRMAGTSGDDVGWGVAVDANAALVYVTGQVGAGIHGEVYAGALDVVSICYTNLIIPTLSPSIAPSLFPTHQPSMQPSYQPSSQPSMHPSSQPSSQPSGQPSSNPSSQPSCLPTVQPSGQPSGGPTKVPTAQPSGQPSRKPSSIPSAQPSVQPSSSCPSVQPSVQPSIQPSCRPSGQPTLVPSEQPSSCPTAAPTAPPSSQPSGQPTCQPVGVPTAQPSVQPSSNPSSQPTVQPSGQPSSRPTVAPSGQPSGQPTCQPVGVPTAQPSVQPSTNPLSQPTVQPSGQPTRIPSEQPSSRPTGSLTAQPSGQPSRKPSGIPSAQPSVQPSSSCPSVQPSVQPSIQPSCRPSGQPTCVPSEQPSSCPTAGPTAPPSGQPSGQPTCQPVGVPTAQPSVQPSSNPLSQPTVQPSGQSSSRPTRAPTAQPSGHPSRKPSSMPSAQPSVQPSPFSSVQPSVQPSGQPTPVPSEQPSSCPTAAPTAPPSGQPTCQPVGVPTAQPSVQPSSNPSSQPTVQPSGQPSSRPTVAPSGQPSAQPTCQPVGVPTAQPSVQPSSNPLSQPTVQPSGQPTRIPSGQPSSRPTGSLTAQPSAQPSVQLSSSCPSVQPSVQPSIQPSCRPSGQPTCVPSEQPSSCPTAAPTAPPSGQPSGQPTCQPVGVPTAQPSVQPSSNPSSQPTVQPSGLPSGQPSRQPSSLPSCQPSMQPSSLLLRQPSAQPASFLFLQPSSAPSSLSTSTLSPSTTSTVIATFFSIVLPPRGTDDVRNGSSSEGNGTRNDASVNASLAVDVLASLSSGAAEVVIVTEEVRVVSEVVSFASPGQSVVVALPLTDQEAILQAAGKLTLPSISLFPSDTSANGSSGSMYVAVAVLSSTLWIPPFRPWNSSSVPSGINNSSPPPLADKVGQLQSDVITVVTVGEGIEFVDVGFPTGTTARVNDTPSIHFTIYCQPRSVVRKSFYCNDTGYVEHVQCNGFASVFRGSCPKLQKACAALDLASMTVAEDNLCQTIRPNATVGEANSTDGELLCRCGLGQGPGVSGSSMIAAGVVLNLGSSSLSKTLQANSAFRNGSAAGKAVVVLSVFVSVWGVALIVGLYFYHWGINARKHELESDAELLFDAPQRAKEKVNVSSPMASSGQKEHGRPPVVKNMADRYLKVLFPAAFLPASFLEGVFREVYGKHMYINFFFRLHHSRRPIVDIIKVVTLQMFQLFLLALLYDLNYPSDDGSCVLLTSESACTKRKLILDTTQTFCQWTSFQYAALLDTDDDVVYFECIYGEPAISFTAATYTSMILSLATCLAMDPLEYILSLLAAPVVQGKDRSSDAVPGRDISRKSDEPCAKHLRSYNIDTIQNNIRTPANPPTGLPKETELRPAIPSGVSSGSEYKSSQSPSPPGSLRTFSRYFRQLAAKPLFAKKMPDTVLHCRIASQEARGTTVVQSLTLPPTIRQYSNHLNSVVTRMAALEVAVQEQRTRMINSKLACDLTALSAKQALLAEFDRAWCLDTSTGLFIVEPKPSIRRSSFRSRPMARSKVSPLLPRVRVRPEGVRDMVQQTLLTVQLEADAAVEGLVEHSQPEVGFEIMVQFVRDLLGRSKAAARVFAMKMEMDHERLQRVSKWVKVSVGLLLVCLNGLFFYFSLLRGISKGLAWQRSYLIAWLLQTVLDVCVFESMQVAWFHYFIPSLVSKDVCEAKVVYEETVAKAVSHSISSTRSMHVPHDGSIVLDKTELNAPDYLFVSYQLARIFPHLVESSLVLQYRSPLPGNAGLPWQRLVRSNHQPSVVTEQDVLQYDASFGQGLDDVEKSMQATDSSYVARSSPMMPAPSQQGLNYSLNFFYPCFSFVRYVAVSLILQLVVLAPLQVQSLFVRVIEPVILSGVLFFFLVVSSRPVFLALTVVALVALAVSVVWEHVRMVRERRRVASGGGIRDGVAHAVDAVHQHLEQDIHEGKNDGNMLVAETGFIEMHTTYNYHGGSIPSSPSKRGADDTLSSQSTVNSLLVRELFSDWASSEEDEKVVGASARCNCDYPHGVDRAVHIVMSRNSSSADLDLRDDAEAAAAQHANEGDEASAAFPQ